jgi:hypothetical protein
MIESENRKNKTNLTVSDAQKHTVFSYQVSYTKIDSVYAGCQALPDYQAKPDLQYIIFE